MTLPLLLKLASFVQSEFGVSSAELQSALAHQDGPNQLPIVLWQYGFITSSQLAYLFDWLDQERWRRIRRSTYSSPSSSSPSSN